MAASVPQVNPEKATVLYADEVVQQKETGLITAKGHVEVVHEGTILFANTLTYHEKSKRLTATGDVRLKTLEGDTIFSQYLEISDDLKEGVLNHIYVILRDQAKLAAATARRENAHKSVFDFVVYSPCQVCKNDPTKDPLWQIKARRIEMDEVAQDIRYSDAIMEFKGVPVLYTPYLSQPAPQVKRRSGVLAPSFATASGSSGAFMALPYFWAISDDKDMTITPMYADKSPGLGLEYRQRTARSRLSLGGSGLANPPHEKGIMKKEFRGHLVGDGQFHINRHWRAGFNAARSTDQTYLRRLPYFSLSHKSQLVSKAYVESFQERDYFSVESYSFQGLRQGDVSATTPLILPSMDYNKVSRSGRFGEIWTFDGNMLVLHRNRGTDMQRISMATGFSMPYYSSWGDVYTLGAKIRGDFYHVHHFVPEIEKSSSTLGGGSARAFPQAYANWRYPFVKFAQGDRYLIEPTAGVVISPNTGFARKQPNEDNRFFELSTVNLMSPDRFAGLDRVDSGSRFNYGILGAAYFSRFDGTGEVFFGQSVAFNEPRKNLMGTGLENKWSDYVARMGVTYRDWVEASMRTVFHKAHLSPKRNEISLSVGQPILKLSTDYMLLPPFAVNGSDGRVEQIHLDLSSQFHKFWSVGLETTRNLGHNSHALSHGVKVTYQDECFTTTTSITRTFYKDRDISPGITFFFRVVFKNLGEINQKL